MRVASHKTIRGLNLNSNPLIPDAKDRGGSRSATVIADNAVVGRNGMLTTRNGFDYFTNPTGAQVKSFFEYQDAILQHQANNELWQGTPTSGSRSQYAGIFIPPVPYRMDFGIARGSALMTTTGGVFKLDKVTGTPIRAGLTKGLDVRATPTGTGAGFLSGFGKVAYRVTWKRTDANGQVVRSDVSSRIIITNNNRVSLTSLTSSAGTATAVTAIPHSYASGDKITISGAAEVQYNGTFTITVVNTTTFTYAISGSPTTPATGTIIAQRYMDVEVSFTAPWDVQASDAYEIWRTIVKDAGTPDPGDECFLVATAVYVGAPGVVVTYTDITADSVLTTNLKLYTNTNEQGALQGNARPPVATTLAVYKDYAIYANATLDHQMTLTLLAVVNLTPGSSAITLHRTDGSGSRTYTAGAAEDTATNTFKKFTGGLSNAQNIEDTVRSLCHCINRDASAHWYAEYTSGPNDNPGIFRIWARDPRSGQFRVTASDATTGEQFTPSLPTSGDAVSSANDARPNRLYFSKQFEPDHVPIVNWLDVGRSDEPILKVKALRDACFIIKSDGVWFLTGVSLPTAPIELDSSCFCIAPETVAVVDNAVYMLSNQGFVRLTQSGRETLSFAIEPAIMGTLLSLSNLPTVAFGVAHPSERLYICWVPETSGDGYAKTAWCFHTFLEDWTKWTKPAASAIALAANYTLYLASGQENVILKQRKTGLASDFSDEELPITITNQTGTTLTVSWPGSIFTPRAGLTVHQGTALSKVTSVIFVGGTTWQFIIDRQAVYELGAATIRMPIRFHARLAPNPGEEAGIVKTFYSATILLERDTVTQATIEVGTNEAPFMNETRITRRISAGWGQNPWGLTRWGDQDSPVRTIPWSVDMPVPDITGETVTVGFIHDVSQEHVNLAQVTIIYDNTAPYETTE